MRTRRVDLGDVGLEVTEAGAGNGRGVLLVHGFTADAGEVAEVPDPLAARRAENPGSVAAFERLQEARPGHGERSRERLESTSPDMWMALAPRFVTQADRLDRLAGVQVPTAVIVGELDSTMLEDSRRMAAVIPGAELTVIPDAGHVPQLEQPEAWWKALSWFLGR